MPALDGVRGLAILGVLLYHGLPALLPGGFIGVELFFVLSGYLITTLLLSEHRDAGQINLGRFWLRRVRRLLPALVVVVVASLAVTAIFLPGELVGLRTEVLGVVLYAANWQLIFQHVSYFEAVGRPPLLQHTWSLAIEEQFYLVWPLLLVLGLGLGRRWRPSVLVTLVLLAAAGSAVLMGVLYQPDVDPSRVYYGTDTRASGLLVGAALAFLWSPGRTARVVPAWLLNVFGGLAVAALIVFSLVVTDADPRLYQGGFVVVDLATAALLLVCVEPRARMLSGALACAPLRWLGLRSYGIYLWHWPVFVLTRPGLDVPLDGVPLFALRLLATGCLAELSYRLIEKPVRDGALGRIWQTLREGQRWQLRAGWAGALGALLLGGAVLGTSVAAARPAQRPAYLATDAIDTWQVAAPAEVQAQSSPAPTPVSTPAPGASAAPLAPLTTDPSASTDPTPSTAAAASDPNAAAAPDPNAAATPDPNAAASTDPSAAIDPGASTAAVAATSTAPAPIGRITAIGDSVMLGAAGPLHDDLGPIEMDAAVSRQVADGIAILQAHAAAGSLGDVVIVHLGNNGTFTARQFDTLMGILADVQRVIIVNLTVPRAWEAPNNSVIASGVQRWPNAVLVDWHAVSAGRMDLFWADGMHLRPAGAQVYADLIASTVTGS